MREHIEMELLNDAFNIFRDASSKLEQQYALLERKIEDLNEELAEKNRAMERNRRLSAMGEMAAKIAHEIRNPLGSMAIFATLLERELSAEPDKKKLAEHITKGVKTLDNLLSNMLLFASNPGVRLKQIDLRDAIEDALSMTTGREKKGVKIKTSFEGSTLVMGDLAQLRQLFLNLLLNSLDALDALDEDGTLIIRIRPSEAERGITEVEVKDNGRGIPTESLDRIFDPFFSTKERGTGLGLAIVSTVVAAHEGFIDVSSEEGRGTRFVISLPVAGPERPVC